MMKNIKLSRRKEYIAAGIVFIVLAVIIALMISLVVTQGGGGDAVPVPPTTTRTPTMEDALRVDCFPEAMGGVEEATEDACTTRGCEFDSNAPAGAPKCFYSNETGGFTVEGSSTSGITTTYTLTIRSSGRRKRSLAQSAGEISQVKLEVVNLEDDVLRIKFSDPNNRRYEVPIEKTLGSGAGEPMYDVQVNDGDVFSFKVIRKATGKVIWDTSVGGFTFSNQFLQLATKLPSTNIYGFGENHHQSFKHDLNYRTWPMFSRDQAPGDGPENLYSVHPFYECIEDDDGHTHGVFLLNSNAMDYTFSPAPMLTYRSIGGILDFYFFFGPTPEHVIQQYTKLIGRPMMPPYWGLGFQLCRYGYNSLERLRAAVDRTVGNNIPLDVQYADIDHYYKNRIFTVDMERFGGLKEYFAELNSKGIRTIIILDPTVEMVTDGTYKPYDDFLDNKAFVKWFNDSSRHESQAESEYMIGWVWPEDRVVFPDFFLNRTEEVWKNLIVNHYDTEVKFDGLWLDMNEPANFDTNKDRPWNCEESNDKCFSLKCPVNNLDDPPYRTMAAYWYDNSQTQEKERLSMKTICMQGTVKDGEYLQYDVHNLYGWSQLPSTQEALEQVTGGRSLIISRSTYPGSGRRSGRWLGDNASRWKDLKLSIIGLLEHNLFGIPYIGADICGFFQNTTVELCKRWQQLGAFYPYSRNHNQKDAVDQDPGVLGEEVIVATRDALNTRYFLLPYLYTLFHKAHIQGNTVVRPLVHEFYTDSTAYSIDEQFLWGPALMICPILHQGQTQLSTYFPRANWYDYYTNERIVSNNAEQRTFPVNSNSKIPLYIRGGYVIPAQDPANNTAHSRRNPFTLLIALDNDKKARGDLFWDDGDSKDTYLNGKYFLARVDYDTGKMKYIVTGNPGSLNLTNLKLHTVKVMGYFESSAHVFIDGTEHKGVHYDNNRGVVTINNLNRAIGEGFDMEIKSFEPPTSEELQRINCFPQGGANIDSCQSTGCTWSDSRSSGVPECFLPENYGYTYASNSTADPTTTISLTRHTESTTMFGGDIDDIRLDYTRMNNNVMRLKFYDPNNPRFEVPVALETLESTDYTAPLYEFERETYGNGLFGFKVKRGNTVIWDTTIGGLTFADKFLQLATKLPSKDVYGFGEHKKAKFRHDFSYKTYPMWARDQPPADYGNLYSVHPFYMCIEDDTGKAHGVLLMNSNAQEVTLQPESTLVYKTVGGILDFYFIFGDNPEHVIQQYTQLIGRPIMPVYWSLGFQISRYGYENLTNMKAAVDRTIDAKIPFDVFYGDIDYFHVQRDFTWDMERFAGLPTYVREMRDKGMYFITILDPFIDHKADEEYKALPEGYNNVRGYPAWTLGVDMDVFVKWPENSTEQADLKVNNELLGNIWPPNPSAYPDWFHSNASAYWYQLIQDYWKKIPFDGLWIDMNEPANFDTDHDRPWNCPEGTETCFTLRCPANEWDDPPYKPVSIYGRRLSEKTICMVARHGAGQYMHYDVHSLYGLKWMEPSKIAMQAATGTRSIIVSRSTFVSAGKYGGRWLGDNTSNWPHLKDSIVGTLDFNLFGIPYIGADVCGYFSDTQSELCLRWHQVGAFYPFYRNHNGRYNIDQDPAAMGEAVIRATRRVNQFRYLFMPYLYTLFYHANQNGNTVVRALMHEFPADLTLRDLDDQFMWGPALLISPVVTEKTYDVLAYFPEGRWFDYHTGMEVDKGGDTTVWKLLDAPLDKINIHLRGGYIIPNQNYANTTFFSRQLPFGLQVIPDSNNEASGDLFWDDGQGNETIMRNEYNFYTFSLRDTTLNINANMTGYSDMAGVTLPNLDWVYVYGVQANVTSVAVDGANLPSSKYEYDDPSKKLWLKELGLDMGTSHEISWTV